MKACSWCTGFFTANVSYQIYCSVQCREEATKEKILERHKENRRKKKNSKTRICTGGCGTKLSIYNDEKMCNKCLIDDKEVSKRIKEIKVFMHEYQNHIES